MTSNDRYIEKTKAINIVNFECDKWRGLAKTIAKEIQNVKSEDVVPVVRCKDCKFYTPMNRVLKTGICDLNVHHMGDNGFCSCGERREE